MTRLAMVDDPPRDLRFRETVSLIPPIFRQIRFWNLSSPIVSVQLPGQHRAYSADHGDCRAGLGTAARGAAGVLLGHAPPPAAEWAHRRGIPVGAGPRRLER